jgi:hypothetical protein
MLSSSVRVAVSTASLAHSLVGCHAPKVAAASASFAICRRSSLHQRRFSSSKTSSPKNRHHAPKALPAREVAASGKETKATNSSEGAKSTGSTRKRRANKASEESSDNADALLTLPSVPNTHHLSQEGMRPEFGGRQGGIDV